MLCNKFRLVNSGVPPVSQGLRDMHFHYKNDLLYNTMERKRSRRDPSKSPVILGGAPSAPRRISAPCCGRCGLVCKIIRPDAGTFARDLARDILTRLPAREEWGNPDRSYLVQKLKLTCKSILRLAAELENGPPCRLLGVSKNREPRIPLGLPRFTLLNTLRAEAPNVML